MAAPKIAREGWSTFAVGIEATRTETHSSNQVQETTQSKDNLKYLLHQV